MPEVIAIPAARIRFYLHKEFSAAEIGILSTQIVFMNVNFLGGDTTENRDFVRVKIEFRSFTRVSLQVYAQLLCGGDFKVGRNGTCELFDV